jgi:hypothetical protein
MESGYTFLYRKIWKNSFLMEKKKRYSRLEAFLYLVNLRARGTDNGELKRGEFSDSYRYLAGAWNWSIDSVYRFLKGLEKENMIEKLPSTPEHKAERKPEHFTICNYETYNPPPNTYPNTNPNKVKKDKRKTKERKIEDSPIFISIPVKNGEEYGITELLISEFESAYPNVDIKATLKKIRVWAIANPQKQWTPKGAARGVNSWISGNEEKNQAQSLLSNLTIGKSI